MNNTDDFSEVKSADLNVRDPKDKSCAPSKRFTDGSCIDVGALDALAEAYNENIAKNNKNKMIKRSSTLLTLNPSKYKKQLVKQFNDKLGEKCNNQRCWLKQPFAQKIRKEFLQDLMTNTFRPKGPQGKFTWLNTFDINKVMSQYEHKYPDFKFLGAVPIDFDDLPRLGISNLDFNNLLSTGKSKIGIIFNLDEHYKDGSHWVSMFADLIKGQVYFSDSYGIPPEPRIRKFMRRVARFLRNERGIGEGNLDVRHNNKRHQYGNSECGVYSINFILRLLKGDTFDKIHSERITDKEVNECRAVYFS